MASTASKWLIGCAAGCGVLLVVVIGVFVVAGLLVRDSIQGFGTAVEVREDLEQRFGTADAFTPWTDGHVPAERLEAFLRVRSATAPARATIAESFEGIPLSESSAQEIDSQPTGKKIGSVFRITRSAFGLIPAMGGFFEARNQALLDNEMGLGEYAYLYTLIYYAWLGHSPDDGPQGDDDDGVDLAGVGVERRVRRDLLAMMRNQFEALPADGSAAEFRESLEAELASLEQDPRRLPWSGGPPDAMASSLEPFRDRLDAAYDPKSNPFELAINEKKGLSIQAR